MLTGFYVLKGSGGALYSPQFPRGGLAANFSVEILQLVGAPTSLSIAIEHKNIEDTAWASAGTFAAISAAGVFTKDLTLLKEQLRFTYTVTATNSWEGILMIVAAPAWRPY